MQQQTLAPVRVAVRWAVGAVVLYGALLGLFVAHYGGPEWFLHLGHNNRGSLEFARKVFGPDVVVPHKDGHDGRYFWAIARDPLLLHPHVDAPLMDRPVYRAQRVAYPLLAAPWRAFGERALLWGLLGTNLVLVGAGAFVAALLAIEVGAPARAALAFVLNPAVVIAMLGDLSDVLAIGALMLALLLLLRRRLGWAIVAGAVAGLAKEPMLLGLGGVTLLWPALARRQRLLLVAVPGALRAVEAGLAGDQHPGVHRALPRLRRCLAPQLVSGPQLDRRRRRHRPRALRGRHRRALVAAPHDAVARGPPLRPAGAVLHPAGPRHPAELSPGRGPRHRLRLDRLLRPQTLDPRPGGADLRSQRLRRS